MSRSSSTGAAGARSNDAGKGDAGWRADDAKTDGRRTSSGLAAAQLGRLERMFDDCPWPDRRALLRARKRARGHAQEVLADQSLGTRQERERAALLIAAAHLIADLGAELAGSPREAMHLFQELEETFELSRVELAREVLRSPELLSGRPGSAVRVQLGLLAAFAALNNASLWTRDRDQHISCACHVGEGEATRAARELASKILHGEAFEPITRRVLIGAPLGLVEHPVGAIVVRPHPGGQAQARVLVREAQPLLTALLQRDILLTENAAAEQTLVDASERKLTRLGFDLHDGPIQDVAVLASDLRLFGNQLERVLAADPERALVRGRVEDLQTQLASLDAELRRLSSEVQSASVLLNRPFAVALNERIRAFAARSEIEPEVTVEGDMELVSTSQQIALLNIVQESLSNIREHAAATTVVVAVSAEEDGIKALVSDDGCGFDVEATLVRAGREGRIGLLAMGERVRLLGGECQIDSRPGGPTVITVALERWVPLVERAG